MKNFKQIRIPLTIALICLTLTSCQEKEQIVSEDRADDYKNAGKASNVMSTKGPINPLTAWGFINDYQRGHPDDTCSWLITKADMKALLSMKNTDMIHIFLGRAPATVDQKEHLTLLLVPVVAGKNKPFRILLDGSTQNTMMEYVTPCPDCIYQGKADKYTVDYKACDLDEFNPNVTPCR